MTQPQKTAYEELKTRFALISNLGGGASVLSKDAQVFMSPGSKYDRSQQMQANATACHDYITDPRVGVWLDKAEADQASLLKVTAAIFFSCAAYGRNPIPCRSLWRRNVRA